MGIKATLAEPATTPAQGATFDVSQKAVWLFWGILPVGRPSLENALAGQLIDGTEVADLDIRVRSSFADLLITALTVGLIVPRSVTYNGVIVTPDP